jgi:hypothetical protein
MNEEDWFSCTDPQPMLAHLLNRASDRKLRLFLCGCLRSVPFPDGRTAWQTFSEPCRRALETAERFADGDASEGERDRAEDAARDAQYRLEGRKLSAHTTVTEDTDEGAGEWSGPSAARYWYRPPKVDHRSAAWEFCAAGHLVHALSTAVADGFSNVGDQGGWRFGPSWLNDPEPEIVRSNCIRLLRDLFGNPFRPTALAPAWLGWKHGTAAAVARHVYEDRAFHELPILADALEDAGCTDADLLGHCRGPGPHIRGCWAVDLILGKQ